MTELSIYLTLGFTILTSVIYWIAVGYVAFAVFDTIRQPSDLVRFHSRVPKPAWFALNLAILLILVLIPVSSSTSIIPYWAVRPELSVLLFFIPGHYLVRVRGGIKGGTNSY